jgi:glycosyltransferase involved in cell wall biosynthesis
VSCCIRAFARVQRQVPSAALTVAGYGSERAMLEQLVTSLGLRHVRFTGRVPPDEMAKLLNEADILLNSPDIDNMPLSLIEAQAAGLPVVSTSTGGIPYIVKDGETGLLVPPGDDEALARAAMRLLDEPGLALRLTRAARASCLSQYTWPAVQDQWVQLYRDLAARRARVAV